MTDATRVRYAALLAEHNRLTNQPDWYDKPRYRELVKEMAGLVRTKQDEVEAFLMQKTAYKRLMQEAE